MTDDPDPDNVYKFDKAGREKRGAGRKLKWIWADDIVVNLEAAGLIDGLLGSTGLTVIFGKSGSAKTFVAVDMACRIAAGLPWHGMPTEQGVVIYIAAEATESVERRIVAWKIRNEIEHLPVIVVQSNVDLINGDGERLVELIRETIAQRGAVRGVIVDTLARAMVGNENMPDDMGKFLAACGTMQEASAGQVIIVHHTGKEQDKGARGHSSLRAAVDQELEVVKEEGDEVGIITASKVRDELGGGRHAFRLETVELGTNSKGRTITTCVVHEIGAPPVKPKAEKRKGPTGKNQKLALDALRKAIATESQAAPRDPDIPWGAVGVRQPAWRRYFDQMFPDTREPKKQTQAFNDAVEGLVDNSFVHHTGGFYWLPRE